MPDGDFWLGGTVGCVLTVVLGPVVPLAPAVGGAVAGYMTADSPKEGLRIGAVAGGLAFAVLFLGAIYVGDLLFVYYLGSMYSIPPVALVAGLFGQVGSAHSVALAVLINLVLVVTLAGLGGVVGSYAG